MEDNVNPSEGTIDAAVQALLNKSTPDQAKETEIEEDLETDTLQDEETESDAEAVEEAEETEAEDTEDTQEDSEEPLHTVTIGGKEMKVTLKEALAGYMKDQDYRKKTAEVAETRKTVEAEKAMIADLSKVRENYLSEVKTLQEVVKSFIVPDAKLDELLKTRNTEGYLQAKAHNEKIQQQINALKNAETKATEEITEEQKKQRADLETKEREALYTAVPELKDDANQKALGSYLLNLGFSQEDIVGTIDHRIFVMAEKARKYDAFQAKAKEKPVSKVPKVLKGKSTRQTGSEIQSQKLKELQSKARRTGSKEDHIAFLMAKNS